MAKAKVVYYITGEDDIGDHFKHEWKQIKLDIPDRPELEGKIREMYADNDVMMNKTLAQSLRGERLEVFECVGISIVRDLVDIYQTAPAP